MIYCSFSFIYSYCPHISFEEMHYLFVVQPQWYDRSLPLSPCSSPSLPVPLSFVFSLLFCLHFISQVEEDLWEQEFMERCFQEMLEEEDKDWFIPSRDLNNQGVGQLQQQLNNLSVSDHHSNFEEVAVSWIFFSRKLDLSYNQVHLKKHFF